MEGVNAAQCDPPSCEQAAQQQHVCVKISTLPPISQFYTYLTSLYHIIYGQFIPPSTLTLPLHHTYQTPHPHPTRIPSPQPDRARAKPAASTSLYLQNLPSTPRHRTHNPQPNFTMGNDGGSIPKRRELVKEASRLPSTAELKESLAESQHHAWTHCALSSRPLATPVVSDALGTLYNKDSVLEFLLAEEGSAEKVEGEKALGGRVKGLRDVVEVKFCKDEEGKVEGGAEKWVCPVTRVEMGPRSGAVYVVPCGHAFAGSVVREVKDGICVEVCMLRFSSLLSAFLPVIPIAA